MIIATQSSQNKSLEAINFVIKGFKKIIVSVYNLMLALDNQMYVIGKKIL